MRELTEQLGVGFGVLLIAALLAAVVADRIRLPKVTAYLLVGILLGPSVLDVLHEAPVETLHPLTQLAMGLVLFHLGCRFPAPRIRRILGRVIPLALGDLLASFTFVAVGLLLLGQGWETSLLLGTLALATAPATTILVLKETQSEGPVTEYAGALVMLNNFVSILAFELVLLGVQFFRGEQAVPAYLQLGYLVRDVAGSLAIGIIGGTLVSYGCSLLAESRWLVLVVAATSLVLGLDEAWGVPYMLSFLAMGLTVASLSDAAEQITRGIDRLTVFLCIVFFVIHGAELNLEAFVQAGRIGAAYITLRLAGKCLGPMLAAWLNRENDSVRYWLGPTLVAQAGAAIALSSVAAARNPEFGKPIQVVILGTVVFFEVVGPLLIRQAVLRAGEVPLVNAIRHSSSMPLLELKTLWSRLLDAVGQGGVETRDPDEVQVLDLLRRNARSLHQSAGFDEVIDVLEHSPDNTFTVVDDLGAVMGVIRYADLSHVLFDLQVVNLINASDLASPASLTLFSDEPTSKALALFRRTRDDCIPVVSREEPHQFMGVVRRRDLVGFLMRREDAGPAH